jgi:hypothetical protein
LGKLAGVGVDGVAGGHGEIRGELIEGEPADLAGFSRFTIFGAAVGYAAQVGRGDPVLAFLGQEVVGDAQKGFDGDGEADFFESFAESAVVKSFEVFEFAADDAPGAGFGRELAKGEERAAAVVQDEDTYADSWKRAWLGEIILRWHGLGWKGRSSAAPLQIHSVEAR